MLTSNEHQVLDYAAPQQRTWLGLLAKRIAIWIAVATLLFVGALALPHPTGIWYFGTQYPKWVVAIDHAGLTIARENAAQRSSGWIPSGWIPVIIAKLIAYGMPVWLMWRFGLRSRRRRRPAGQPGFDNPRRRKV